MGTLSVGPIVQNQTDGVIVIRLETIETYSQKLIGEISQNAFLIRNEHLMLQCTNI